MLNDADYAGLNEALKGRNLQALWWATEAFSADFVSRVKIFFSVLERLLREKKIKLAKHGNFLEGSVEGQVDRFRRAFPLTEPEMEDGIWFFDEACPGGAVWVLEDGSLEWTESPRV